MTRAPAAASLDVHKGAATGSDERVDGRSRRPLRTRLRQGKERRRVRPTNVAAELSDNYVGAFMLGGMERAQDPAAKLVLIAICGDEPGVDLISR